MRGVSTLESTGETRLLLTPSNTPIPTTLAFAEPCYLGSLTPHSRLAFVIRYDSAGLAVDQYVRSFFQTPKINWLAHVIHKIVAGI